jgi:alpha-D-xyloside xylohydrolase
MFPLPHNAPSGFDRVVRLESINLENGLATASALTASKARAQLAFESLEPGIWHIRFVPPGAIAPAGTPMLVDKQRRRLNLDCLERANQIRLSGPSLTLVLDRDPWCMRLLDSREREVVRENPADLDGLGSPFVLPLGYIVEEGKVIQTTISFHLHADEHLFGLGEKFTPLDKKGQRITGWNVDALGSTTERSHKNIPFLWSSRGYGLFIDSGSRITWDLGFSSCQSYTVLLDAPVLDAYLIHGDHPAEILLRYAELTGHAPVPPRWSFGLWVSSGGTYRDRGSMEALVEGLKQHDVPADVVHVDPWWMRWRQYCDFVWDESAFPRPKEFIDDLHARSLRLCLWEHPYVSVESALFQEGETEGFFVRRPDGGVYIIDYGLSLAPRPDGMVRTSSPESSWNAKVAIIDLTNPKAYAWFQDLHRPIVRMGADVFKTDFGEDIPLDGCFWNGETGATMHNLYPLLYNRAVSEVTRQERGYGVVWSRSGTAGSQRYPVCWSGDPAADFDSLACTIRGGLSVGMSGIPFWSNDIGAYRGTPSEELYIRWAQFGLFCSHSRMHGDSPREPWAFGERALGIVRAMIALRYTLFPYLYSTAHEAHLTGLPVLRALPLMFPDDPNCVGHDLEYLLGPLLLVAPVYEPSGHRMVYFPEGSWIDWWTGESYEGKNSAAVAVPLDHFPLFVRGGAILPRMEGGARIPAGLIDPLVVSVYPSRSSRYTFREDEGTTEFESIEEGDKLVFTWEGGPKRRLVVAFRSPRCANIDEVQLDGQQVSASDIPWYPEGVKILCSLPESQAGMVRVGLTEATKAEWRS